MLASEEDIEEFDYVGDGFLKKKQIEYLLCGDSGLSNNQIRQHRYQIRNGLQGALIDFGYLDALQDKDLAMALGPLARLLGAQGANSDVNDKDLIETMSSQENSNSNEDYKKGGLMYSGLVDFIGLLVYVLSDERARQLIEEGVNVGYLRYLRHSEGLEVSEYKPISVKMEYDA